MAYNNRNGVKSGYTCYTQNVHGDVVNLTDFTGAIVKSYKYDTLGASGQKNSYLLEHGTILKIYRK